MMLKSPKGLLLLDSAPRLLTPAAGAAAASLTPTFTWRSAKACDIEIRTTLTGVPTATGVTGGTYTSAALAMSDAPYRWRVRERGGAWSAPRSVYVNALVMPELALWLDYRYGTYQDSAGTVEAVALGDPVGKWQARGGSGLAALQTLTSLKPLIGADGLVFDGVDDVISVASHASIVRSAVVHIYAIFRAVVSPAGYLGVLNYASDNGYRLTYNASGVYANAWDSDDLSVSATPTTRQCAQLWRTTSPVGAYLRANGTTYGYAQSLFRYGTATTDLDIGRLASAYGNISLDSLFILSATPAAKTAFDTYVAARSGVTV